jgi:hypothetical protein
MQGTNHRSERRSGRNLDKKRMQHEGAERKIFPEQSRNIHENKGAVAKCHTKMQGFCTRLLDFLSEFARLYADLQAKMRDFQCAYS